MLESDEAARRLGVKVTTLYAYVSRGMLASHRAPSGRRSLFDMDEVERLARRSKEGKAVETRMATVTTGITHLTEDGPIYRGRRATELATETTYEEVAEWLWDLPSPGSGDVDGRRRDAGTRPHEPADEDLAWVPLPLGPAPQIGSADRMSWAVVMVGAHDPLRADLRPEAVVRTARRVAASMVNVLPPPDGGTVAVEPGPGRLVLGDGPARAGSMAERLAFRLSPVPTDQLVRGVNAALILLADHELATSTMAVRVAASTRADICDALLAGLGTVAGPLHGGASQLAFSLLVEAERNGVEQALNDTLRWQGFLPGFGHTVYKKGDPRFAVLWEMFTQLAPATNIGVARSLIALAGEHSIPRPNVDLALAAMAWATGMPPDAGRTIFAVARVAGWVAHYLEELGERPLRYRARAVYASSQRT
jgi:citrate synthase